MNMHSRFSRNRLGVLSSRRSYAVPVPGSGFGRASGGLIFWPAAEPPREGEARRSEFERGLGFGRFFRRERQSVIGSVLENCSSRGARYPSKRLAGDDPSETSQSRKKVKSLAIAGICRQTLQGDHPDRVLSHEDLALGAVPGFPSNRLSSDPGRLRRWRPLMHLTTATRRNRG